MLELAATYSEAQTVELLSALAACDGMPKIAARRLKAEGVEVAWTELRRLREVKAPLYQALAVERSKAMEESMEQEFRELVRLSQKATRHYLEELVEAQENGTLDSSQQRALPQIIQALQKVAQVGTDKTLSLSGRPTDGGSVNPLEAAQWLIDAGVLQPVARPVIESTAEEVS